MGENRKKPRRKIDILLKSNHTYTSLLQMNQVSTDSMDLLPYEQNFDLDKSRQNHGLKEHHKISNIPTFRCEIL
jgi:hypothetical protein